MFLRSQITGLDKISDAPKIEQAILQRRAGQRQAMFSLELLDGLRDLRGRVLDELGLVEHERTELKLLQCFEIPAEDRVVGDDDVVLGNLFAQVVPG